LSTAPLHSALFFNTPATHAIYTLSLHDALPIYRHAGGAQLGQEDQAVQVGGGVAAAAATVAGDRVEQADPLVPAQRVRRQADLLDRKSTRLNSSHVEISYAVFCLKKKSELASPL